MKNIHEEGIFLTEFARDAWFVVARQAVATLKTQGITLRPDEIPDEELWLHDDGKTLVIRCEAGKLSVSMTVPEGQWSWVAQ